MKKDIIIVGGGIVGLMSAYCLHKEGRSVTVIDKGNITNGVSFGNAGLLSAFKKSPLSAPGVVSNTLKLMLKGESPVNLHPTLDPHLYKWLQRFVASSSKDRLRKTLALFELYGGISLEMYQEMVSGDGMDFYLKRDGLLMVYTQEDSYQNALKKDTDPNAFEILSREQTREYMPILNDHIAGSILLKENAHLDPGELMTELKNYLESKGVEFILGEEVTDIRFDSSKVSSITTDRDSYEAEVFILATGADDTLARKAQNRYIMTPAKGYSITFEMDEALKPKTATLFADLFIAMTPRRNTVRMTSKLELGSTKDDVVQKQIESIYQNLSKYSVDFEKRNVVEWAGFRPLTPNDMPIIGIDQGYENLVHANGLGWLGITMGPAVGKIISDLITKDKKNETNKDILLFSAFYQG